MDHMLRAVGHRLSGWLYPDDGRSDHDSGFRALIEVRCRNCGKVTTLRSTNTTDQGADVVPVRPESWFCNACGTVNHKTLSQRVEEGSDGA
jgi:uncharacterized Zn finger protein